MDWHAVLPVGEAIKQVAWERRLLAWRMHEAGLKWREVGERMGVAPSHARNLGLEAKEKLKTLGHHWSPVGHWLRSTEHIAELMDTAERILWREDAVKEKHARWLKRIDLDNAVPERDALRLEVQKLRDIIAAAGVRLQGRKK